MRVLGKIFIFHSKLLKPNSGTSSKRYLALVAFYYNIVIASAAIILALCTKDLDPNLKEIFVTVIKGNLILVLGAYFGIAVDKIAESYFSTPDPYDFNDNINPEQISENDRTS